MLCSHLLVAYSMLAGACCESGRTHHVLVCVTMMAIALCLLPSQIPRSSFSLVEMTASNKNCGVHFVGQTHPEGTATQTSLHPQRQNLLRR